jgi:O-antigen biosynthesis protein
MLHVIHGHGGGTEYHVRALIASACKAFHQYLLIAVGDTWQLESHTGETVLTYDFRRLPEESWSDFLGGICARFAIELIHLHNISGCRDGLMSALAEVRVPYGYTVHDLNFACPTITFLDDRQLYCGGVTDNAVCSHCLALQPDFAGVDIQSWRERHRALLACAAFVVAPSPWAASMLRRYFPEHDIDIIPHASSTGMPRDDAVSARLPNPDDGRSVVAVIGAIGPDKGSRRLERLVELTRARALHLRWVLIGYLDRGRDPWQSEDGVFTMHGPYDSRELAALLEHYKVRLVAYPSVGPETFSFTLSESWTSGLPAIVPPIGALAERVRATGAGWVLDESEWSSDAQMLDRIASILDEDHRGEYDAARERARAAPQSTLDAMVSATLAIYERAKTGVAAQPSTAPIAVERCLDALHYTPWTVPAPREIPEDTPAASASPAPAPDVVARFAQAALRIRHTLAGRMLYRIAPKSLVAALKTRLSP